MSGWLLPALVRAVALVATCLRPLRSGAPHGSPVGTSAAAQDLERRLRQARADRDRVHAR